MKKKSTLVKTTLICLLFITVAAADNPFNGSSRQQSIHTASLTDTEIVVNKIVPSVKKMNKKNENNDDIRREHENEEEEEKENAISDAAHIRSAWYKELVSRNPNIYRLRSLYASYFETHPHKRSYETNAYMRFLQKNMINVDAKGYVLPILNFPGARKTDFNTATIGGAWTQLFTKWKTNQAGGNDGVGVVRSIAIDPGNTNRVLAGGTLAAIWKTTDEGVTWKYVSQGTPHVKWVNDIAYIKNSPATVYASTDMGVIKSTDGGENWSYTGLNNSAGYPNTFGDLVWLGVTSHSTDTVYATIRENNLYYLKRTTDGGTTWTTQQVFPSGATIWDMKVKPNDAKTVYIVRKDNGAQWINGWRSTDGGINFTKINSGYPADAAVDAHRARLAVTPANPNVVYIAIGYNGGDTNDKISFFKSSNAGVSFTKTCCGSASQPLVYSGGSNDFLYETCHLSQITWNFAFAVSATNENFLACAANKIKVSNDGGATWHYDLSGTTITGSQYDNYQACAGHKGVHGDHHGMAINGSDIWNTNDGGVYHSGDGGNTVVKDVSDGLAVQELWGFGQAFKRDIMAVGLNHNAINMRDDAAYGGWVRVNGADAMAANVNPIDDQYLYTHPWGHDRVKRNTTANSGHVINPLGIELGYITLDNIEFDAHQYHTIYASDYGDRNKSYRIAKTTNNADSWTIIKSFATEQKNAVAVKQSYADTNYIYAVVEPNKVWRSTNAGAAWTEVSPPTSLIGSYALWRLAVSDKNPDHLWVSVKGHQNTVKIIRSTDGGSTWQDHSTGLPAYAITSMIYQRGSDDGIYIGTTYGVYYRKSGMAAWEQFGANLPATQVSFMHINYAVGKIRIGTQRGIYENALAEITPPKANISVNKRRLCTALENAQLQFADYSVLHNDAQTKYSWSFPGGNPSTSTSERPLVSYANAAPGAYNVSLTVTDQYGTSTQTLNGFIVVSCDDYNNCGSPVDLPKDFWTVQYADSYETTDPPANAIDGNSFSIWHTRWSGGSPPGYPHEIQINLGDTFNVSSIKYLPRQDENANGRVANYEIYVSANTSNWGTPVATGTFGNDDIEKVVSFTAKTGKYIRFRALSEVNNNIWASAAEIGVVGCRYNPPPVCSNPQDISPTAWTLLYADSQESTSENGAAVNAFDGNSTTKWHTQYNPTSTPYPHEIQIDLNATYTLSTFKYLPRQDGNTNGRVKDYEIYVSTNASNWGTPVATGTFANDATEKVVSFTALNGRYIRFRALSEVNGNPWASAAEIKLAGCLATAASSVITGMPVQPSASDSKKKTVEIFPNPARDVLNIKLTGYEGNTDVQIYDIQGRLVLKKILNADWMTVNISRLEAGVYTVKVKNKNEESTVKMIKK